MRLAQRMSASPYDLVYVSSSSMMPYAVELDPCIPVVADFGEVDSEWWAQKADEGSFPAANFFRTEATRLRLAEVAAARRAVRCIAANPRAAHVLAARAPDAAVVVIPDGVDHEYFAPLPRPSSTRTVAIVGRLDDAESVEALARFCLTTVPSVRAALPGVRFLVTSRKTPMAAGRLAEIAGIEIVSRLDDIRPLLRDATLAVAPLPREGSRPATIVEAMLSGLPVVATRAAAERLGAVAGRDLEVEDNPLAFARQVVELLRSPDQRAGLAARGQVFARDHHSWDASTTRLLGLMEASVPSRRPQQIVTLQTALEQPRTADGTPLVAHL